ncbi:hypothetical protein [Lysinibacillus boronitolerans]|uniref:hypothetical protein n=1 Tax=Lysinibacillus boronitolerans TaxID=309788 RepID=UPI000B03B0AB|nr:hypothetical protein [Lysinibacillus boronitolerans]
MTFDEYKADFLQIASLEGIKVTEDELIKLFISQLVINSFEHKQLKNTGKKKG